MTVNPGLNSGALDVKNEQYFLEIQGLVLSRVREADTPVPSAWELSPSGPWASPGQQATESSGLGEFTCN